MPLKIQNSKFKIQNLFVVGTDTGVGKTVVTALLALYFQARGVDCGVMKPFASGCEMFDGQLESEDARFLKNISGVNDEMDILNPARWREPLTPLVAAQRADDKSDYWSRARATLGVLQARHECVIVEGVGGVLAPIAEKNGKILSNLEWAKECELPVVVVARRGLGTINHTLLTLGVLRAHGIEIEGLVFCDAEPVEDSDIAVQTSPALIAKISGVPIWGEVSFTQDLSRANLQDVARKCFGAAHKEARKESEVAFND
jgi:dethiobiotin synthetase